MPRSSRLGPTDVKPTTVPSRSATNVDHPAGGRSSRSRQRAAWMKPPRSSSPAGKTWRYAACQPRSCTRAIPSASVPVAVLMRIVRRVGCRAVKFEHVLVVGAGQMGGGIAQVVASSGRRVSLHDPYPGAIERGLAAVGKSLAKLAEKGGADPEEVLGRISPVDAIVAADLMIEAVVEDVAAKVDIFGRADGVLPPEAILASNTSSIPIATLAAATGRPDRVIGMHFFNPVPVMAL